MADPKLKDRIAKLLKLGKSPNVNEAAAAKLGRGITANHKHLEVYMK